jgi:hypothetical protein
MSFTYKLNSTGKTSPHCATSDHVPHVEVAERKDVWNDRQSRYEDKVFTR